ncbi:MAG: ATP-dependent DNA ligase, partial [Nanoarchaeota archaeon]
MDYKTLVEYYSRIESTTKRLEKTGFIAELLDKSDAESLSKVVLLLKGTVFPDWDERKLGVASKLVLKALSTATGMTIDEIEKEWKKTGDLGNTAENLIGRKKQSTLFSAQLTVAKVYDNLVKLATLEGQGTVNKKMQLIAEILTSAEPDEAKYIVRTVLGDLRVGASQGTLRDGIVLHYFKEESQCKDEKREKYQEKADIVQQAYDLTNDFAKVVETLEEKGEEGLKALSLEIFKPVNPMLFPKAKDIEDGFSVVDKPAFLEYKYDGFRVQIHKDGDDVKLFTRRLENVTAQFPDVVERVRKHITAKACVLDSEVLGTAENGSFLPFQHISQRIRRKYDIKDMAKKIPVVIVLFDVLKNGEK